MIRTEASAGPGRVLFVDDDAFYRDIARDSMTSAGYVVSVAASGVEAMQALETGQFDLAVLDLCMPGLSGFEVIEAIRGGKRNPNVPILVITGHDDAESVARAFDSGATTFLAKPLNWILFVHHVQFVLKAARAESELRHANRTAEFMSDLKSRLVGTLVSEFQAPLRNAAGFARLLLEEADGPIASELYRDWIGELHRALERMSATHLKMLNFGRSLSEGITLKDETVAIGSLVAALVHGSNEAAARRLIRVHAKIDLPAGFEILADPVLLAQAVRNVVDNAIRLSRRNTDVAVRVGIDASGHLSIEVADTSTPLGPSEIEDILGLKPFATPRLDTIQASTGMKLSRVLIDAHQGKMLMKSLGEGMLTELRLPRQRVLGVPSAADQANRLRTVASSIYTASTVPLRVRRSAG